MENLEDAPEQVTRRASRHTFDRSLECLLQALERAQRLRRRHQARVHDETRDTAGDQVLHGGQHIKGTELYTWPRPWSSVRSGNT